MSRLEEIEARATAATEGPWYARFDKHVDLERPTILRQESTDLDIQDPPITVGTDYWDGIKDGSSQDFTNMDFAAQARQDIPWLCAELRKAQTEVRKYVDRDHCISCGSSENLDTCDGRIICCICRPIIDKALERSGFKDMETFIEIWIETEVSDVP